MVFSRFRNAGRAKIYDEAMLRMLWALVAYPVEGVRFQLYELKLGTTLRRSFSVWAWLWKHNRMIWRSL